MKKNKKNLISISPSVIPASTIPSSPVSQVLRYENIIKNKKQIIKDNKCRGGIYKFTNKTNGKKYIGHSKNLSRRFSEYFRIAYLNKTTSMPICNALIKHGHKNFCLEILEYCECEASQEKLLEREKYYIQLLPHTERYNIVEDPTIPPMSGRKHSKKTIKQMSENNIGENNPFFGKTHSSETLEILSENKSEEHKIKIKNNMPNCIKIVVSDIKKESSNIYPSICEAARALDIPHSRIVNYFAQNQQKPFKGRYIFKKYDTSSDLNPIFFYDAFSLTFNCIVYGYARLANFLGVHVNTAMRVAKLSSVYADKFIISLVELTKEDLETIKGNVKRKTTIKREIHVYNKDKSLLLKTFTSVNAFMNLSKQSGSVIKLLCESDNLLWLDEYFISYNLIPNADNSLTNLGKFHPKLRDRKTSIPVYVYSQDTTTFIKRYSSLRECVKHFEGSRNSNTKTLILRIEHKQLY